MGIKQTKLYHRVLKAYMYRKYKPGPVHQDDREVFDEISENGFKVIESFMDPSTVSDMLEEVEAAYQNVKEANHADYFSHSRGHERIGNIPDHAPSTKAFYENEFIWRLARAYVTKDVLAYRQEADFKYEPGRDYQANTAHFDDWRHRFKAFLFLHDVGEENAPMTFFQNSHKGAWRDKYEVEFTTGMESGRYGHFFPQEMAMLERDHGIKPVRLTATAGTLFLGDFRGIHQGTRLISGKRVLLNCTFGL